MSHRPAGLSDEEYDSDYDFMPRRQQTTKVYSMFTSDKIILTEEEIETLRLTEEFRVAITAGDIVTVESIFSTGRIDINQPFPESTWTPLHYACSSANPKMIKFFLDKGADVNDGFRGCSLPPIIIALLSSEKCNNTAHMRECVNLMKNKGFNFLLEYRTMTALMLAAKDNLVGLAEIFLDEGVKLNKQDKEGRTAVHHAAVNGYGKVIRFLIERGADMSIIDEDGQTAYEVAAMHGYANLAEILYRAGTTKWIPGSDPSLLNELSDPNLSDSRKEKVLIPQREQIEMLLDKMELGHLVPLFKEHKINYLTFLRLTDEDLRSMGVKEVGIRWKIIDSVRILHNADWNKASLNSLFLQGLITSPEVLCMLNDIRTHINFMTQSMVYLQKRLKAEPTALISGSECTRAHELRRYTEATLVAVEELRVEAEVLKKFLTELQDRREFKVGDLVERKRGRGKWVIGGALLISGLLVITKFKIFRK